MGDERELKFPVENHSDLRSRLIDLEAERTSKSQSEDNWIFDRGGNLREQGRLLRLRFDGGSGAVLTFKGPPTFEGPVKIRLEHETRMEDPEAIQGILEELGYRVVTRYQKRREKWRVGGITVCLDTTPMGDFVEFEGDGAQKLAERCGFSADEAERRTYLDLYSDYRREHPEAPEEMLLP
jgi:adenylate cyclase class 2